MVEGYQLRKVIQELKVPLTELSEKTGIGYRSLYAIVKEHDRCYTDAFAKIAEVLGITLDEAYYGIDHSKQQSVAIEQQLTSGEQKIIDTLEEVAGVGGKPDTEIGVEALYLIAHVFNSNGHKEQAGQCLLKAANMEMAKAVERNKAGKVL